VLVIPRDMMLSEALQGLRVETKDGRPVLLRDLLDRLDRAGLIAPGDALAEVEYFRAGGHQLGWDPATKDSPIEEHDDHAGEPVFQIQLTYHGTPAWICGECNRVQLLPDNPYHCPACGAQDHVGELWRDEPLPLETAREWGHC
jgi:hypothetical protein